MDMKAQSLPLWLRERPPSDVDLTIRWADNKELTVCTERNGPLALKQQGEQTHLLIPERDADMLEEALRWAVEMGKRKLAVLSIQGSKQAARVGLARLRTFLKRNPDTLEVTVVNAALGKWFGVLDQRTSVPEEELAKVPEYAAEVLKPNAREQALQTLRRLDIEELCREVAQHHVPYYTEGVRERLRKTEVGQILVERLYIEPQTEAWLAVQDDFHRQYPTFPGPDAIADSGFALGGVFAALARPVIQGLGFVSKALEKRNIDKAKAGDMSARGYVLHRLEIQDLDFLKMLSKQKDLKALADDAALYFLRACSSDKAHVRKWAREFIGTTASRHLETEFSRAYLRLNPVEAEALPKLPFDWNSTSPENWTLALLLDDRSHEVDELPPGFTEHWKTVANPILEGRLRRKLKEVADPQIRMEVEQALSS